MLIKAGIAESDLAQVDDETLMKIYQEVLADQVKNSTSQTGASATNTNQAATGTDNEALKNMTAAEVRELLKQQGYTEEELNKIDDETLMQTWQEILAEEGVK